MNRDILLDRELLGFDIAMAKRALRRGDFAALLNAMEPMVRHVGREDLAKFFSLLLVGCAERFLETVPSFSWVVDIARLVERGPHEELLRSLDHPCLAPPVHYYDCIESLLVSLQGCIPAVDEGRSDVPFEDTLANSVCNAIAAVYRRPAQFRDPDRWALIAARWRWSRCSEGPPPSNVDRPEQVAEDFDEVRIAMAPVMGWLESVADNSTWDDFSDDDARSKAVTLHYRALAGAVRAGDAQDIMMAIQALLAGADAEGQITILSYLVEGAAEVVASHEPSVAWARNLAWLPPDADADVLAEQYSLRWAEEGDRLEWFKEGLAWSAHARQEARATGRPTRDSFEALCLIFRGVYYYRAAPVDDVDPDPRAMSEEEICRIRAARRAQWEAQEEDVRNAVRPLLNWLEQEVGGPPTGPSQRKKD